MPDGRVIRQPYPDGTVVVQAIGPEGPGQTFAISGAAPLDLIVQFRAPPLARARRLGLDLEASLAPARAFAADLSAIAAALPARAALAPEVRLRASFQTAFNGAAVSGPPELVERLRALPYVARVFRDDSVHVTEDAASPGFPAVPAVAAGAAGDGKGIRVAIVDSGIDYRHPALGGCFGPGCRVEGGFDFVNVDYDPMDDMGHGTHVAGIIGADQGFVGIAPAVHFLAYKVVDAAGNGLESTIIRGIEFALDPDRTPATDDAVNVINLSLGGRGDADSPLSQAVDEAVASGVVCVVAAGNEGDYFGVGTPGAARHAITVGASNRDGTIASFSSRGPAGPDWDLKPDLAAPGVSITSTWLNDAYATLSGTSMAAPYVAGAAALLLEAHPDWGPERIKAVLMNGAVPAAEPFTAGAGVVYVSMLHADLDVVPGSLGFGRNPLPHSDWTSARALRLYNLAGVERQVSFSVRRDSLPAGVSLRIDPPALTIAAGDSGTVTATLEVAAETPYATRPPSAYSGSIVVEYEGGRRLVPYAFLQGGELTITAADRNALMMLHDDTRRWLIEGLVGEPVKRLVTPGRYDLIALLLDSNQFRHVVREGIAVADQAAVELRSTEAVHTLRSAPVDQNGRPVPNLLGFDYLHHQATGFGFISIFLTSDTETISSMSDAYTFEWVRSNVSPPGRKYTFLHYRHGIDASFTFQNAPTDLRHVVDEYHFEPGVTQVAPVQLQSNGPRGFPRGGGTLGIGSFSSLDPPYPSPCRLDTYFMEAPADIQFGSWFKEIMNSYVEFNQFLQVTPFLRALPGEPTRAYLTGEAQIPIHTLPAEHLRSGFGPPMWFGRFDNQSDSLRLHVSLGDGSWLFPLQGGAWTYHGGLPFALRRNGAAYLSGTVDGLGDWFGAPAFRVGLAPDAYSLTITDDRYFVDQRRGVARVVAAFDSRAADPDPPYLTSLSVLADGVPSDTAGAQTNNEIRFRVADDGGVVDAVSARARGEAESRWASLDLVQEGEEWRARLPDSTGYLSLEVEASDHTGNRFVYTMEPAVHLTSAYRVGEKGRVALVGHIAHLSWRVPADLRGPATVYRTENDTLWTVIGAAGLAGDTFLFDDRSIELRHRYGWRLGVNLGGLERRVDPIWVWVPGDELSLAGVLRSPSLGAPTVAFVLPDSRPATLEVMDVGGRLLLERAVGVLGAGSHRLDLAGAGQWRPGVYWVRVRHPAGTISRKFVVLQ